MPMQNYIDFAPSYLSSPAGAQRLSDVPRDEIIEVSVYLKPRPDTGSSDQVLPADDLRAALHVRRTVQHQDDIRLLSAFAAESGPDGQRRGCRSTAHQALWTSIQNGGSVRHNAWHLSRQTTSVPWTHRHLAPAAGCACRGGSRVGTGYSPAGTAALRKR